MKSAADWRRLFVRRQRHESGAARAPGRLPFTARRRERKKSGDRTVPVAGFGA